MPLPLDTHVHRRMRKWFGVFIVILFTIPSLVLIGWIFDIYSLRTFFFPPFVMLPLTAVCFILVASAKFLLRKEGTVNRGRALVFIVMAIGLLRVAELFPGVGFSIDRTLFPASYHQAIPVQSGRMSPVAAICFILAGVAMLLRWYPDNLRKKLSHYVILVIAATALFSILGYIYRIPQFTGFWSYLATDTSTALCFFIFSLAILFADPGKGIMKEFTSTFGGSLVARLMIPVAIVIPSVLGLLSLQGNWAGLYTNEFGTSLLVLSIIIIFASIIWYNSYLLNQRDLQRKQVEDALIHSEQQIKAIFQNAPDAVIVIDSEGRVNKWNPEAENVFGWKQEEVIGRYLSDLIIPPEFREAHINGLRRYLETGQSVLFGKTVDLWAIRKDGSGLDVSLRISPLNLGENKYFIGFVRDITDRKQMEDRLKRFNEELTLQVQEKTAELTEIFERITDGFIALDKNFRYTYVNKKIGELVHRDPASLLGRYIWDEFPDAIGTESQVAMEKAFREQQFVQLTEYYAPLDLWLTSYVYPSPNGLSVFIHDITAEKKAELEISKARNVADRLIDSLPGVFYFFDQNGKFIHWNREFEKITGFTSQEISEMHPADFFVEDHKDYIRERIEGVFSRGINDAEASFLTKDGHVIPYFFKAVLIEYNGGPCLLGTGIDITERKKYEVELIESERKYKLLFESNPLPMWMLSLPEYRVMDVNNAAVELYGYTREEFLALSVEDFRPAEDVARFRSSTSTKFRGIYHAGIWRHKKKDGTLMYMDIVTYDLKYHNQETRLVLGNNVTEKHIAEEKLKESYEAIRKLTGHLQNVREEERLHMSREIHDELGQLITVLKMDVSWLNKKIGEENTAAKNKVQEILGVIDTTAKTVRRIASELRPSLLDNLGLVAAMEWHLEEFEKRSGITKKPDLPDSEIQLPNTHRIGLFRIFQESLTNVARHSGATEVFVSLKLADKHLNLVIKDNGQGFDERQEQKKTLGLLGMKERSQMMGGRYNITSNPGEGTTVTVVVPLPETGL